MKGTNNLKITNPSEGVYFKTKKPQRRKTAIIEETMTRINKDISGAGMIASELKSFYWFNMRTFMNPIRNRIITYNCKKKITAGRLAWVKTNEVAIRKIGGWRKKK